MRLDVLGMARALGAVPAASAGGVNDPGGDGRGIADDAAVAASFASAWLQSGAVLALHPSR